MGLLCGTGIVGFGAGDWVDQRPSSNALRATAMASFMSDAVPLAMVVRILPSIGDRISIVAPSDAGTAFPLIR